MDRTAKVVLAFARGWLGYLIRRRPVWAILYVTRRCNLSCSYCLFKDDESQNPALSDLCSHLDGIRATGCRIVSITGGEPTLRADLPEVVSHCRSRGMVAYLNTNGIPLTASLVDDLGAAGLDIVNLSLDSAAPNESSRKDLVRGRRALELLLEGRERHGYAIISNQVITRENVHEIHPLLDRMQELGVYVTHGVKYPVTDAFPTAADRAGLTEALEGLIRKKRKGYPIITSEHYLESAIGFAECPSSWECLAGKAFFVVDLDGGVTGCDRLPPIGMPIAELGKQTVSQIHAGTRQLAAFPECASTCMINCAFETSFLCASPRIFLAELMRTVVVTARPRLAGLLAWNAGKDRREHADRPDSPVA